MQQRFDLVAGVMGSAFLLKVQRLHALLTIILAKQACESTLVFLKLLSEAMIHLWPAVSIKYNTASPVNGAVKACEDDPAEIGSWVMVSPVAGLNHSTASLREVGIAERSIVKEPPEGE
jgi:hypothetical protein